MSYIQDWLQWSRSHLENLIVVFSWYRDFKLWNPESHQYVDRSLKLDAKARKMNYFSKHTCSQSLPIYVQVSGLFFFFTSGFTNTLFKHRVSLSPSHASWPVPQPPNSRIAPCWLPSATCQVYSQPSSRDADPFYVIAWHRRSIISFVTCLGKTYNGGC